MIDKTQTKSFRTAIIDDRLLIRVLAKMKQENIDSYGLHFVLKIRTSWIRGFLDGKYKRLNKEYIAKINEFLLTDSETLANMNIPKKPVRIVKNPEYNNEMPKNFKPHCGMIMPRIWADESSLLKRWRGSEK